MVDRRLLEQAKVCIDGGRRFVLTTHVNPDGDGLGSEAALAAFLVRKGKEVDILNSSSVPDNYKFLDETGSFEVYNRELHRDRLLRADYVFILDISDWGRLREIGVDIKEIDVKKICIDHHPTDGQFVDLDLIDVDACSTGEIIFDLLKYCAADFAPAMAEALFTSIMTDTGSFRFSNTSQRAFAIAAELVKMGAKPHKIHQKVNERESLSKVKLFGHLLRTLRLEHDGRIAVMTVTQDMMNSVGAKSHDTDGFADFPRKINGVEVSILFIEKDKKRVKMSLRSNGNYIINGIAQKFGGGGHPFAAGALLEGDLEVYIPQVLDEVKCLLGD